MKVNIRVIPNSKKESAISKERVKEIANKYYLVILIVILVAILWILKKRGHK